MIEINTEVIEKWVELRKMIPQIEFENLKVKDGKVLFTYEELKYFCEKLNIKPENLLKENFKLDLTNGIKVSRSNNSFKRTSERNGKKYYTYNHLVTTNAYPTLMPLRVELHCNDNQDVVLNGGHDSTEIVYITKGAVRMHWDYEDIRNEVDLYVGDSAFIQPGVSHSFMALNDKEAELIAVNW
ncbi:MULTISPECIES: cupin domain-containing protein [Bacillus]|uniref:Uncharacterized protein n=1 Tax=Bacillus rugosus TaxID=2715209 RepID=A0ACD3ZY91_9BACI|nr:MULTISPECIES: cupin domain-containing protein [Bacillus]MBY4602889.1 hypothetical protein [Bacillus sp. SPARC3]UPV78977.1 hypothetical protein M0696_19625 [Bacillus rugosus]